MIVAGIGCRAGIDAAQVEAAIDTALREAAVAPGSLSAIAIPLVKAGEAGIIAAAAARHLEIVLISQPALEAASPRTLTRSVRAMAAMNVHSVSEAAALAAAGPQARLLRRRTAAGPVTCALAEGGGER